jgi:hypothetical protein
VPISDPSIPQTLPTSNCPVGSYCSTADNLAKMTVIAFGLPVAVLENPGLSVPSAHGRKKSIANGGSKPIGDDDECIT